MMMLPIALTFGAGCALLNIWLGWRCAQVRIRGKVLHGDGGDPLLARRMRAHANFIEYTPITLLLLLLVELAWGESPWLWGAGAIYLLARIAHAFGMDADKPTPARGGGIMATWLVTIGLALAALYAAYAHGSSTPAPAALSAQV
ncbi:hypothetical protein GGR44_002135 [Sphingobium fontiphilum]|uniref:MAPEG family protein n=2 Tax=Sphingobium fontiphilum TaxID=944425 RepID=A0A7W6GPE6_9SPHN|nr:hypothetical protein [Sphingobium fontiphilum]